ncbi:MAG TPA: transposase [Tepidisphaeraceae bacterium]|jgi:putative transposase|nr:transposase [Tepidisphaeraceae bacterium]
MPRSARIAPGGVVFHCLNGGNEQCELFADDADYAAFERVLEATLEAVPVRLLAYCLMPNHWHLLLWPRKDGDLGRFMQRLTTTHVRRWRTFRHSEGRGHLYQGVYKSFPVEDSLPFLPVARYVEQNALRAKLVSKAEDWQWNSVWRRERGSSHERGLMSEWPVERPADWLTQVNRPQPAKELAAVRESLRRGRPFGDPAWQAEIAIRLGLQSSFRPPGRPKKDRKREAKEGNLFLPAEDIR